MAGEAALGAAGASSAAVALAVLVLAPGLALTPLLPAALRRAPLAGLAAAPALGLAAAGVLLVSAARLGVPIEGWSVRGLVAALCLAALPLRDGEPRERPATSEIAILLGALALGLVLAARVVGDVPVPGNDWAKYILYGDEIRRQGSLLIDNPFWMLGQPFREDPGIPALYGGALTMSGAPASALAQGIALFALMGILATFAFVRAWWGAAAGGLAAALYAAVPVNHDILGWHGLANVAALALLALALAYVVAVLRGEAGAAQLAGLALTLVGLAAVHRLTTVVALLAFLTTAAVALLVARGSERRRLAGALARTGALAAVLGAAVAADLLARQRTSGGTQGYEAYLASKVPLGPTLRDLTIPLALVALGATAWAVARARRDRGLWPVLSLLAVSIALAYAWLVRLPLPYLRLVYFLPLALVPLVAIWLTSIRRRPAIAVATALVAVTAGLAWGQARNVRIFYAFSDRAALRGLDSVADRLGPDEVVVTDRCWSFLTTWLLHTRTLAALAPEDIGPGAEVPFARQAQAILDGTPAGLARARGLGVRFLLVDPTCVDAQQRPLPAPLAGEPLYVSRRLAVLRLPGRVSGAGTSRP